MNKFISSYVSMCTYYLLLLILLLLVLLVFLLLSIHDFNRKRKGIRTVTMLPHVEGKARTVRRRLNINSRGWVVTYLLFFVNLLPFSTLGYIHFTANCILCSNGNINVYDCTLDLAVIPLSLL